MHTISYLTKRGTPKVVTVLSSETYADGTQQYFLTNGARLRIRTNAYGNREVFTYVDRVMHGGTFQRIRVVGSNVVECGA